ncbi:MAG: hypothetical protein FJZ01_02405 [Candidatus Sericytochromatia bacterium]|nr:hypothetical protein [Candidatus Tanganyikabacteria bacterium]
MADPVRSPAPHNIGETTLRIVLDHFPEAQEVDETGNAVFSQDALRVMHMVKGLRTHNAGQETIRRVIQSYVPTPAAEQQPIPIRRAPGVIAQDARAKATAITAAADEVADGYAQLMSAMDRLSASIEELETRAEQVAHKPQRYDAFLGDLARLIEVSRSRKPLPPGA